LILKPRCHRRGSQRAPGSHCLRQVQHRTAGMSLTPGTVDMTLPHTEPLCTGCCNPEFLIRVSCRPVNQELWQNWPSVQCCTQTDQSPPAGSCKVWQNAPLQVDHKHACAGVEKCSTCENDVKMYWIASRDRNSLSSTESHLSMCSVMRPESGLTLYSEVPVNTAVGFHGSNGGSRVLASIVQRATIVSGLTTPMSSSLKSTSKAVARNRTFTR